MQRLILTLKANCARLLTDLPNGELKYFSSDSFQ